MSPVEFNSIGISYTHVLYMYFFRELIFTFFKWISSIFRWGIYGAAGSLFSRLFLWRKWDLDFSGSRLSSLGLHYRPAHHRLSNEAQNQNNNFWRLTVWSPIFFQQLKYFFRKTCIKISTESVNSYKDYKNSSSKTEFFCETYGQKRFTARPELQR